MARAPSVDPTAPRTPWRGLSGPGRFFEDDGLRTLREKATRYAQAGICINLSGAAGLGKTALALRIADALGRPVSFMSGHQWLTAQDFIGREVGQSERTVVDKYVQSVRRTETQSRADWRDAILAAAMRHGHTLVYDEFTRSAPEANSALLSVLEEGILVSTDRASQKSVVEAHPSFRILLTSNPHDYVGVNGAPDALMDRIVTFHLQPPGEERLAGIACAATGLDPATARRIVSAVSRLSGASAESPAVSCLRSVLMVARIVAFHLRDSRLDDAVLAEILTDVLRGRGLAVAPGEALAALAPKAARAGAVPS